MSPFPHSPTRRWLMPESRYRESFPHNEGPMLTSKQITGWHAPSADFQAHVFDVHRSEFWAPGQNLVSLSCISTGIAMHLSPVKLAFLVCLEEFCKHKKEKHKQHQGEGQPRFWHSAKDCRTLILVNLVTGAPRSGSGSGRRRSRSSARGSCANWRPPCRQ